MSEDSGKIDILIDLVREIDRKQDAQSERLVRLEVNTDRNTESLDHHIKRTDLLEESLNNHKKAVAKKIAEIEEPKKTVKNVGKFLKWFFGIVSVVAAAIFGILRLYKIL